MIYYTYITLAKGLHFCKRTRDARSRNWRTWHYHLPSMHVAVVTASNPANQP